MTPRASPPAGARSRPHPPFVVVTGLSGSGKSQAIRALEDLGYFCVDNLPIMLIPTLAQLSLRPGSGISRVAIVVDVRERTFLARFPKLLKSLRRMRRLNLALIFLEASDAALVPTVIGTTGERDCTGPPTWNGSHPAGHSPPAGPRAMAWTARSFDVAMIPAPPTVGGVTEKPPVLKAHLTAPVVTNGRPRTKRPVETRGANERCTKAP